MKRDRTVASGSTIDGVDIPLACPRNREASPQSTNWFCNVGKNAAKVREAISTGTNQETHRWGNAPGPGSRRSCRGSYECWGAAAALDLPDLLRWPVDAFNTQLTSHGSQEF